MLSLTSPVFVSLVDGALERDMVRRGKDWMAWEKRREERK